MVVKSPPQSRYRANPHQKVSSCPFVSQVVTLLLLIIAAIIEPVCAIHSVKTFRCIASHFTLGYTFIDEETDTHWVQLLAQHHETSQFAAHPGLSQSRGYMLNHYASLRRGRIHSNVSFLAFFFFGGWKVLLMWFVSRSMRTEFGSRKGLVARMFWRPKSFSLTLLWERVGTMVYVLKQKAL